VQAGGATVKTSAPHCYGGFKLRVNLLDFKITATNFYSCRLSKFHKKILDIITFVVSYFLSNKIKSWSFAALTPT
jgi:hypothetical protein